jgi:GT2 family glycosyltransferase
VTPELSVVIPTFNNADVLARCLDCWRTHGTTQPVELLVIEDGCRDRTPDLLAEAASRDWGRATFRWIHTDNVHELRATNLGLRDTRAPLVMTWHDDMFLLCGWLVPELLRTFRAYEDLGLLCLSRGLRFRHVEAPIARWDDVVDWRRNESTIGPSPFNWIRLQEVDGVVRPWVVRRACLDRVGVFDEAFVPTGWDESDLAYRIRQAGWVVAVHGYERDGAYRHLLGTTFNKFGLNLDRDLANGRLFFTRWADAIRSGEARSTRSWPRRVSPAGLTATLTAAGRTLLRGIAR